MKRPRFPRVLAYLAAASAGTALMVLLCRSLLLYESLLTGALVFGILFIPVWDWDLVKGAKWGVLTGSAIMTLALGLPPLGILPSTCVWFWWGLLVVAGAIAGGVAGGSQRKRMLAGVLCAAPATVVYAGVQEVVRACMLIPPAMGLWAAGLGAIGGLISYAIKAKKFGVPQRGM
jgi:hypothetical protein